MTLNRLVDSGQALPAPDVQRTTLGLDVLARFVCNTWDEATGHGTRTFDAVVIGAGMFGGYCAERIFRQGTARGLRVLVLDAGPFVLPTHVQNLPRVGLNVPGPLFPAQDPGTARELVWGMPWRSNVECVGQAYCVGGKSLYWGGWCPRLLDSDLASWPSSVQAYFSQNYPTLEQQTGVDIKTDFIQGPLFEALRARADAILAARSVPNLDLVEEAPLAVQGQAPASGLFSFDKYSSVTLLVDALREAANDSDDQRRLFLVPNAHAVRLLTQGGAVTGVVVQVDGAERTLPVRPNAAVILALGTIESTRMALSSLPRTSDPQQELMGRNFVSHVRSNIFCRVRRGALDPNGSLPQELQTGALLLRGSTAAGKFHVQVTASADVGENSDALLFAMIPDIDQLNAALAHQQDGFISLAFRGVSEMRGDKLTPVPNDTGRFVNLSPWESDEFGVPRAYAKFSTTPDENALADAMDAAISAFALQLAAGNAADVVEVFRTRDALGTTYHEAGTLWMGSDPLTSVTDSNGRFHHVSNAFAADQSLFVNVGSVNPTLTGLVLARKVSEAAVALASGAPAPP